METQVRENYREVLGWLRGSDNTPNPEMEDRFLAVITTLVQERMRSEEQKRLEEEAVRRQAMRNRPSPLSLRALMNGMNESGECDLTYDEVFGRKPAPEKIQAESKVESEIPEKKATTSTDEYDSVFIGKVFRYLCYLERHTINMSQLQIIMYISYGAYLASTGSRLTTEHPQMWQFGPVFARAYNKMKKDNESGKTEYETLEKQNPRVLDFLKTQFRQFGWVSATVTTASHIAPGTPWAKARKNSPDKWGATIEDSDIAEWFAARM